jgi:hypothetical protein
MSEKKGTSTAVRVMMVVGGLAALGLVCTGVVTFFVKRSAEQWVEGMADIGPRVQAEAVAFALDKDQDACIDEALRRGPGSCGDLEVTCAVEASLFLYACLPEALPVGATCEGVPPATDIMDVAEVLVARCAERGYPDRQGCTHVLQNSLVRYCDEIRPVP